MGASKPFSSCQPGSPAPHGSTSSLAKTARELGEAGARVVVAVKELEAWILAGLCYSNAEEIQDPSWELRRAKGVLKSEHTYREIAMSLDLELYRCKPLS